MDYSVKANLTTILSTYLIPMLIGYGCSAETSNAIVGIIVTCIIIGFNMLNEMYTSKHLTKTEPVEHQETTNDITFAPVEEPLTETEPDNGLLEYDGDYVSMSSLGDDGC